MSAEFYAALRACARTESEKRFACGLAPWDTNAPECNQLTARMKRRGWNIDNKSRVHNGQEAKQASKTP